MVQEPRGPVLDVAITGVRLHPISPPRSQKLNVLVSRRLLLATEPRDRDRGGSSQINQPTPTALNLQSFPRKKRAINLIFGAAQSLLRTRKPNCILLAIPRGSHGTELSAALAYSGIVPVSRIEQCGQFTAEVRSGGDGSHSIDSTEYHDSQLHYWMVAFQSLFEK